MSRGKCFLSYFCHFLASSHEKRYSVLSKNDMFCHSIRNMLDFEL